MKSIFHILPALLLVLTPHAQANVSGASVTSCYNHFIYHIRFSQVEEARSCEAPSYLNCRILLLDVRCADESLPYCCNGLDMMDGKRFMYTLCDYFFEWSSVHNIGYLIQARVDPGQSLVFSNTSEIVGTWTPRIGNKVLYCNSSMLAGEHAQPLPNSITHSMIYLQQDVDAPQSLNMTWMAYSTLTSSNSRMENSIDITFFYTVVRDVSNNYFPYTRANLSFELRPHPSTLPTTVPPTTVPSPTSQTITDDVTSTEDTPSLNDKISSLEHQLKIARIVYGALSITIVLLIISLLSISIFCMIRFLHKKQSKPPVIVNTEDSKVMNTTSNVANGIAMHSDTNNEAITLPKDYEDVF